MKMFVCFILLTTLSPFSVFSQNDVQSIIYTKHFTDLAEATGLDIRTDSLEGYLITDKVNPYLKNSDLYLINPQKDREYIIIIDENSMFPQLKFSSHVTNLMNNENDHTVAFYSLDEYFILTELRADWAVDSQFIPKDHEDLKAHARSFYNADAGNQVTVILIARELPLLRTPAELSAISFR